MKTPLLHYLAAVLCCTMLACKTTSGFQPNIPNGGRIVAVTSHPDNDQVIIAAAETGGLFRTVNGGNDWVHINSLVPFKMGDVEYSQTNPDIIIATTQLDLQRGRSNSGIWRSTDSGKTWTHPDPAQTAQGLGTTLRPINGYGIAYAPNTSTVVVGMERGLAMSTDNGGTWKFVKPANPFTGNVYALIMPDANKIIAGTSEGVYYSHDGGLTWKAVFGMTSGVSMGQSRFAMSPLNNNHLFLATDNYGVRIDPASNDTMEYRQTFLSTDAGINWKEINVPKNLHFIRQAFIRTCRSTSNPNEFILYYGDGVDLYKKRVVPSGSDLDLNANWEPVKVKHTDPTDMAFDQSGSRPLLLSGDGGILTYNSPDDTWYMTGGGNHGLHALQVMDIAGIFDTKDRMAMWQFGTWDNSVWNSADDGSSWPKNHSGEGFHMQFEGREDYDHSRFHSVHVSCYECSNVRSWGILDTVIYWESAKDSMKGNTPWYLFEEGHYVQSTSRNYWVAGIPVLKYELHMTQDRGDTWKLKSIFHFNPHQRFHVVEEFLGPMMYIPVDRSDGLGLIRVRRFTPNGIPIIYNADGEGYGSLAEITRQEGLYPVMAVNPRDPQHLIMADIGTNQMKYTYDGGKCWYVDEGLTRAVTENGNLLFSAPDLVQPTAIAFDPEHPRVVVGTYQAGLFESKDDGVTWAPMPGTKQMTNVSSLFYGFHDDLVVSTYGRGLWKIKLDNNNLQKRRHAYTPCREAYFDNIEDGLQMVFDDPFSLPENVDGQVIIIPDGEITDIVVNADGVIDRVAVDRGSLMRYDTLLHPHPVRHFDQTVSEQRGNFDRLQRAQQLVREGKHIRGIVERDRRLLGFILSDQPMQGFEKLLVDTVITGPYIYLLDKSHAPAYHAARGDTLILTGIHFDPQKPLTIFHEGEEIASGIHSNADGGFMYHWMVPHLTKGRYTMEVVQEIAGKEVRLQISYMAGGDR